MRLKFFFLMTVLVIFLTAALVVPLLQLGNIVLTNLSKNSTENAISILSNTAVARVVDYMISSEDNKAYDNRNKNKKGNKIISKEKEKELILIKRDLQEALINSFNNWPEVKWLKDFFIFKFLDAFNKDKIDLERRSDIKELFVIDSSEEILAHSNPRLIGDKYSEYKNVPEFQKEIERIIKLNLKEVNIYNNEITKLKDDNSIIIGKIETLTKQNGKYNNEIEKLKEKQSKNKEKMISIKNEIKLIEDKIQNIEKNPLISLEEPVNINTKTSYTIIYPIIYFFGNKSKTVGIFFATVSTEFIHRILILAIIIALGIALVVFLISILFIQLYAKIIINPIIVLTDAVKQIANGNLDMKIPFKGKDEIAILGKEFNNMLKIWREKLLMEKYVSKSTASMIRDVETGKHKGTPQRKFITIFFSDIRGFTTFSEKFDPLKVINTINAIFNIQVEMIKKYDGDIDKFVGDEIMADFPNPVKAFKAAVEIQKQMIDFNKGKDYPLQIGIGINYGEAVVGSVGAKDSYDWTAIGDTINLGARLCQNANPGKIIISDSVYKKINYPFKAVTKLIQVKGKKKEIKIYEF